MKPSLATSIAARGCVVHTSHRIDWCSDTLPYLWHTSKVQSTMFHVFQVAKRFIRSLPNISNLWQVESGRTSSVWTSVEHGLAMDRIAPPASLESTLRAAVAAGTACTSSYFALSILLFEIPKSYQNF